MVCTLMNTDKKYYIKDKFPKCGNFSVGVKDNDFVLRRYILKYLAVKCYTDCNQFLNSSEKRVRV